LCARFALIHLSSTTTTTINRFAEFGELERCLLVRDSGTGLSRGTAFVTFKEVESARSAIKASNTGKVVVLGKVVIAMAAVDRSEAKEYGKEGRERLKGQRDKRNMYLKDEGLVDGVADAVREAAGRKRHEKKSRQDDGDGSGSAQCPPGDLAKRQSAHAEKKAKLTNPLFFISPLRLSVRNVARHLTDSDLKRIFKAAADEGLNRGLVKLDDVQVVVAINNNIVSSLGLQLS
jgi:nucleolar protein 4